MLVFFVTPALRFDFTECGIIMTESAVNYVLLSTYYGFPCNSSCLIGVIILSLLKINQFCLYVLQNISEKYVWISFQLVHIYSIDTVCLSTDSNDTILTDLY